MADDYRSRFDDAVRTAEEARDGGSNDGEIDALWEAIDAATTALADAAAQLASAGATPAGS